MRSILSFASLKRVDVGQSWFPESWTEIYIENAANYIIQKNVIEFGKLADGIPLFDNYKGVRVGIIKTNGKWATVFPDNYKQPNLAGNYITNPKYK
jgi:hypothetical protein